MIGPLAAALAVVGAGLHGPWSADAPGYYVYVAAESEDVVALARFDAGTREVEVVERVSVGYQPTEVEGPHGLTVDPSGEHWYLTIAHGKPFGFLYKYETGTNDFVARCELGLFPATMQVSAATGLLYCVNFNLHGKMTPSTVSIVDPEAMVEVARTTTGAMPHGSRLAPDGLVHYSCAMMDDTLVELDAVSFDVTRRLRLTLEGPGEALAPLPSFDGDEMAGMGGMGAMGDGMAEGEGSASMPAPEAKPTWVQPHPSEPRVYVALNAAAQVVEVDTDAWRIARRFQTDKGPYNLDVTSDGARLVVSYKGAKALGVWDLAAGEEVARVETTRAVTHGVVVSPDARFAFVSNESVGGEPGTLDVVDLVTNELVASTEIGLQAGGIAFWKLEAAR